MRNVHQAVASGNDEGGLRAPPGLGPLGKAWWWFHLLILVKLARLRFIALLLAIGLVIVKWETLKANYEKWTRPASVQAVASADSEFWCPMHPTIVRDHPDNCPICGMPLSKRKKDSARDGEAVPPGVRRLQLTPYRMALAGLQISELRYERLDKEIKTVGFVEFDERKLARISARLPGKTRIDKLFVNFTGQSVRKGQPLALLYNPELVVTVQNLVDARRESNRELERVTESRLSLWGVENDQIKDISRFMQDNRLVIRAPIGGHVIKKYPMEGEYVEEGARLYDVADLSTVWIEGQVYEEDVPFLREGMTVSATTKAFPNETFRGKVAFVQPHLDASTRTVQVRFDMRNPERELRPGMYATVKLATPMTELDLVNKALNEAWRDATVQEGVVHAVFSPGGLSASAGLAPLLEAAVSRAAAARGLLLAVPETAVIDTGSRKLVYGEIGPNLYAAARVQLGPRSGMVYPVLRGLTAGDRVATAGSFLLDADTRLAGDVGSTYFGAGGGPAHRHTGALEGAPPEEESEAARAKENLAKLSRADRELAAAQTFCPITKSRLGTMGKPFKIVLEGQPVFLCCQACEEQARAHPHETLTNTRHPQAPRKSQS
jgi:Cu(I)/Ag(I) efflux system membrane fusion protein